MSYIVPRDIPKGCEQCPFNGHTKCRTMPIGFDEYPLVGRRPEWCPLVDVKTMVDVWNYLKEQIEVKNGGNN